MARSVSVPVAIKLIDVPAATLGLAGEIVMAVSASTVSIAVAVTDPSWQVMVTGPIDNAFTTPTPLTVATPVADDDQVAKVSICSLVPSLKLPMACKLNVELTARPALAGVSVMDVSVPEPTVRGTDPITPSNVAEIVVAPAASAVAIPIFGLVLLTVAAAVLELDHATFWVIFCVVESLKLPTAV